jgi:hypothetical protein
MPLPRLPAPARRLALMVAGAIVFMAAWPAAALDAPTGKVVLTVTGQITVRNIADAAQFDMAMLEKLPQTSFHTRTPWYPEPRKFTGVRLRDLLAALGAQGRTSVSAQALNDYRAVIPAEDWNDYDVLVAWHLDDAPMLVRDKGPLVIIYPFDAHAKLRSAVRYGRAVWQLKALDVR